MGDIVAGIGAAVLVILIGFGIYFHMSAPPPAARAEDASRPPAPSSGAPAAEPSSQPAFPLQPASLSRQDISMEVSASNEQKPSDEESSADAAPKPPARAAAARKASSVKKAAAERAARRRRLVIQWKNPQDSRLVIEWKDSSGTVKSR